MNLPLDKRTTTNMTSKGQVLIPKDVRDAIGLVPGHPVDVGINDRGEAVIAPGPGRRGGRSDAEIAALMAALEEARATPLFTEPTDDIMRFLRGDEPLP